MYCTSCGAWNPDDSRFCGKCGRRVQATADTSARVGEGGAQASRTGLCLATLMAGVIIVLGVVAVGAFVLRDQLSTIWPGSSARPTAITASPTPSVTRAPVGATATPLPSTSPTPLPAATATLTPAPALSPTPIPTPTRLERTFKLVYRDCVPHAQALGSVKGQVLDRKGAVIVGAKVRITIDGYDWKSDVNPATTNADGWYEWILQVDQKVKFVELTVDGRLVPFSPQDLEVKATGGCFQRVDFIEQ